MGLIHKCERLNGELVIFADRCLSSMMEGHR